MREVSGSSITGVTAVCQGLVPAHAVTETLLKDVVLNFIPFRASIQVMIGLFPLRLVNLSRDFCMS